jgi:hypothetical protein
VNGDGIGRDDNGVERDSDVNGVKGGITKMVFWFAKT